jgi:hypothetical protein
MFGFGGHLLLGGFQRAEGGAIAGIAIVVSIVVLVVVTIVYEIIRAASLLLTEVFAFVVFVTFFFSVAFLADADYLSDLAFV